MSFNSSYCFHYVQGFSKDEKKINDNIRYWLNLFFVWQRMMMFRFFFVFIIFNWLEWHNHQLTRYIVDLRFEQIQSIVDNLLMNNREKSAKQLWLNLILSIDDLRFSVSLFRDRIYRKDWWIRICWWENQWDKAWNKNSNNLTFIFLSTRINFK